MAYKTIDDLLGPCLQWAEAWLRADDPGAHPREHYQRKEAEAKAEMQAALDQYVAYQQQAEIERLQQDLRFWRMTAEENQRLLIIGMEAAESVGCQGIAEFARRFEQMRAVVEAARALFQHLHQIQFRGGSEVVADLQKFQAALAALDAQEAK